MVKQDIRKGELATRLNSLLAGENIKLETGLTGVTLVVTRVMGGWIYLYSYYDTNDNLKLKPVFVPKEKLQ